MLVGSYFQLYAAAVVEQKGMYDRKTQKQQKQRTRTQLKSTLTTAATTYNILQLQLRLFHNIGEKEERRNK